MTISIGINNMNIKFALIAFIVINFMGCTALQPSFDKSMNNNHVSNYGEIFTYDFDPSLPQVDSGFYGTLIEKNGCLLIQPPVKSLLTTPILPHNVSKWDKANNTLYIEGKAFPVGQKIFVNGVSLYGEDELNDARKMFKSEANPRCLKDKWVIVGTHIGESGQ